VTAWLFEEALSMASVSLSGSLTIRSRAHTLSKSYTAGFLIDQEFDLAAGAVHVVSVPTAQGTTVKFTYIKAVKDADPTQSAAVKYGVSDAEASDPTNGTNWIIVNGLKVSWEEVALSTQNKIYVYNHGAEKVQVELSIGLEGA
jgi:hypothetical protein